MEKSIYVRLWLDGQYEMVEDTDLMTGDRARGCVNPGKVFDVVGIKGSMTPSGQRIVGPETLRMLALGHPWIIADSYTKRWPAGTAGELVELTDGTGHFIATALLDPEERVIARVLAHEKMRLDHSWLTVRLDAAVRLRRDHADLGDSDTCRLVNGEGDGLPGLTVDRYGDYLMVQLYCAGWRPHLSNVTRALQELLSPRGIYEKTRPRNTRDLEASGDTKKYGRLLNGTAAPERLSVRENGLTFLVELERGLNTGLFLDQRDNRRDLLNRARGKRVLNLFAYTGAFTVAAVAAGAELATNVDVSPTYTDWAKANFGANKLNPKRHEFIIGDCQETLTDLARKGGKPYDIILMDPPSFSTTTRGRFTTRGGTSDLVAAALPLLSEGGLFIASSNHQKVDVADYLKELRRGALQAACDLRVISLSGQPVDFPYPVTFPEGRYLKYAVCVKAT